MSILNFLIILLSLCGLSIAFYIHHKKHQPKKLVCPIGSDCDKVVRSEYAKFFGLPVELLGVAYYGLIFLSYLVFLAFPEFYWPYSIAVIFPISLIAVLFSFYLVFIQIFTLKEICTWCMGSALISCFIFALSAVSSDLAFVSFLGAYHEVILIVHVMAMALGLGGATITDVLFFRFLKDKKISWEEKGTLDTLSQFLWTVLAIAVVSGLGLYLPEVARLNESAKFLVKAVVVLVIIINGATLNLLVSPKLIKLSFDQKEESRALRRLAFGLGAVSIVSWYSAFILGMLKSIPVSFMVGLAIYIALLVVAIFMSQLTAKRLSNERKGV